MEDELRQVIELVQSLNPRPGSQIESTEADVRAAQSKWKQAKAKAVNPGIVGCDGQVLGARVMDRRDPAHQGQANAEVVARLCRGGCVCERAACGW